MNRYPLVNQKGMGLIEVLVTMAIMAVMVSAIMTLMEVQRRQVTLLVKKQDALELRNIMLRHLTNANTCTWQLQNKTFDATTPPTVSSPSPTAITLVNNTLYSGANVGSAVIAKAGEILPTSQGRLRVQSVSFRNIYAKGAANEYEGTFEVVIDPATTEVSMQPIQVTQRILVDAVSPAGAKKITSCDGAAPTGLGGTVYATPGNFTFIAPESRVYKITVVGGGGGGGNGFNNPGPIDGAGGGGAGGTVIKWMELTKGTNYPVVVGAAGAGGPTHSPAGGSAGGNSSFNVKLVGNGGSPGGVSNVGWGGGGGNASDTTGEPGAVIISAGGDGESGGDAGVIATEGGISSGFGPGGIGGASSFGGGGRGGLGTGGTGRTPGSGGGGGSGQNADGGPGASGIVIIE